MSDSSATPTVDELRERGAWSPALDKFAEWDPDWTERCARMTNNPWTTGVLPVKWIELICTALNAVCTHRNEPGVRRHVRAALRAGATRDEILETFKGVSVLGIHSVAVALPILFEEAAEAGVQPTPRPADTLRTPVIDQLKAAGTFNEAWDAIYQLDPRWLEEFLAMGADMYSGVLPTKLHSPENDGTGEVELMAIAVDAGSSTLRVGSVRSG
jgi:alkylhydroperoxidase/carboxymuconolactone decarboxylase family protein YurZ